MSNYIETNDGFGGFKYDERDICDIGTQQISLTTEFDHVSLAPRLNQGKPNMKYWLMFPHAAKAICERLTENEDKYPNDGFNNYNPQETVASLIRHLTDATGPEVVHNPDESERDHLVAVAFNALCLLESVSRSGYKFPRGEGRCL